MKPIVEYLVFYPPKETPDGFLEGYYEMHTDPTMVNEALDDGARNVSLLPGAWDAFERQNAEFSVDLGF